MSRATRLAWWVGAGLVSLAAALWLTYPAWLDLDHAVLGEWRHPDMISNHWLYRWVSEQLLSGGSIVHNDRYYFPIGDAPWLAGNGSDAVPYTLLAALLPWPGSVTWWAVLTVTLNGLAGAVLARVAGAGGRGAVLAAAMVAMSPYVAHEMTGARFSQVPLYWLGFFLAAWCSLLDGRRRAVPMGVLAGLLFGAAAFSYWYYGLWAALAGGLIFMFRPRWRALVAFVPTALIATLPPLLFFLRHWAEIPGTAEEGFPHPLSRTSGLPLLFFLGSGEIGLRGVTLPLALTGLAGWWIYDKRRQLSWAHKGLVAVVLAFYLLALGPSVTLPDGTDTGLPGPFALVYWPLAVLRRFWWPYRHVALVTLGLAPLAALGADAAMSRLKRWAVPALLAALVLTPYELALRNGQTGVPSAWWEPPVVYESVAELEGGVILELPIAVELATSQQTLSYQWVHHKKLVNGHAMWVDRVRPDAWDDWVQGNSFLSVLAQWERGQLFAPFAFKPEDVDALREAGLRYLVVNAEYYPRALYGLVPLYKEILDPMFGQPVLSFRDQLFVWDLEGYGWTGHVDAPDFRLPQDYAGDGTNMLDVGHNRSLGWRTLSRLFPPVIPPREPVADGSGLGAPTVGDTPGAQVPGGVPQGPPGEVPLGGAMPGYVPNGVPRGEPQAGFPPVYVPNGVPQVGPGAGGSPPGGLPPEHVPPGGPSPQGAPGPETP